MIKVKPKMDTHVETSMGQFKFFLYVSFALLYLNLNVSLGQSTSIYRTAPNASFTEVGTDSDRADRVKRAFEIFNPDSGPSYKSGHIRHLTLNHYIDLSNISTESLRAAQEDVQKGNIILVDSCVGNATRLGSPPGGKGVVLLSNDIDISFLTAKYIRYAVEAHLLGGSIRHILWYSPENEQTVKKLLDSMVDSIRYNLIFSQELKDITISYLQGKNIILMGHAELGPVIDEFGRLTTEKLRNLGAGELVPALHESGLYSSLSIKKDTKIIFSNIDFDFKLLEVVAATHMAKNPDLFQVQVVSRAPGGSAYLVRNADGHWKIMPLEHMEVPPDLVAQKTMHNTNTVVLQGRALNLEYYRELDIPFERKVYDGRTFWLPKQSLCDIGKHPEISVGVGLGPEDEYFFAGSKNLESLTYEGRPELFRRIEAWQSRAADSTNNIINNVRSRSVNQRWDWLGRTNLFGPSCSCYSMATAFF